MGEFSQSVAPSAAVSDLAPYRTNAIVRIFRSSRPQFGRDQIKGDYRARLSLAGGGSRSGSEAAVEFAERRAQRIETRCVRKLVVFDRVPDRRRHRSKLVVGEVIAGMASTPPLWLRPSDDLIIELKVRSPRDELLTLPAAKEMRFADTAQRVYEGRVAVAAVFTDVAHGHVDKALGLAERRSATISVGSCCGSMTMLALLSGRRVGLDAADVIGPSRHDRPASLGHGGAVVGARHREPMRWLRQSSASSNSTWATSEHHVRNEVLKPWAVTSISSRRATSPAPC